jgi:hypothetical protein
MVPDTVITTLPKVFISSAPEGLEPFKRSTTSKPGSTGCVIDAMLTEEGDGRVYFAEAVALTPRGQRNGAAAGARPGAAPACPRRPSLFRRCAQHGEGRSAPDPSSPTLEILNRALTAPASTPGATRRRQVLHRLERVSAAERAIRRHEPDHR